MLLFSVLYGLWVANLVAFNGDVMRELAIQFSALAEKQSATWPAHDRASPNGFVAPAYRGHRRGTSPSRSRDRALRPGRASRSCDTVFGQDVGAASLSWRSIASWLLGYPDAALADAEQALEIAREADHLATLVYVLNFSICPHIHCGDYATADALIDEYIPLKEQMGSPFWGGWGMMQRGCLLTLTGKAPEAVRTIASGVEAMRSTGTTMWMPLFLSYLAQSQRGHWSVRRGLDQDWRSDDRGGDNEGELVRSRDQSRRRRNCLAGRESRMPQRRKLISPARLRSLENRKRNPGSSGRR